MSYGNAFTQNSKDAYKSVLRRIDASDILDHFDADNVSEQNGELIHSCLIDRVDPHHSHGDANPSAAMNINSKAYNCFTYGGGDLFWFLEKMKGSLPAAIESLGVLVRDSYEDQGKFIDKLKKMLVQDETVVVIPKYSDRLIKPWEGLIHPYLTEQRGLDEDTLNRYRVGWSDHENRIIMPHFFNGKLVGWQRRSIPSGYDYPATLPDEGSSTVQKYKNSAQFPKHLTLFNYDEAIKHPDSVIVTEGVMRIYRAESFEGRPFNVVSSFSAKVSKEQCDLLSPFKKVYLMLDGDWAGYVGAYWAIKRLSKRTNVYYMHPDSSGRDLDDMTAEEVELLQRNATPGILAVPFLNSKLGK